MKTLNTCTFVCTLSLQQQHTDVLYAKHSWIQYFGSFLTLKVSYRFFFVKDLSTTVDLDTWKLWIHGSMDPVSCWHLATSPHPHHRQCPPLPSNMGKYRLACHIQPCMDLTSMSLHASSMACRRGMRACSSHKLSSAMLKRTPQLEKIGCMVASWVQ